MRKKTQLKLSVFFTVIIIIVVYFYVNKDLGFSFEEEWLGIKNYFGEDLNGFSNSAAIKSIKNNFNIIKDEIEERDSMEGIIDEKKITEKVLEKISQVKNIVYEYEPWDIKFDYPENMSKQVELTEEKINLYYEDIQDLGVVIQKEELDSSFNDWLNNNHNLQKLDKKEYNDLIFWIQDLSNEEYLRKEYYTNIGEEVFTIVLESTREKEEYWNYLEDIIKSFKKINL